MPPSIFARRPVRPLAVILMAGLAATLIPSGSAAEENNELTALQFRAQVQSRRAPKSPESKSSKSPAITPPEISLDRVDQVFLNLLEAQGREAAARQSVDRLSGWSKAAAARLAADSVSPLDAETLQFAESQAVSRLAQFEAERRQSQQQASLLLGKEADSALVALAGSAPSPQAPRPAGQPSAGSGPPASGPKPSAVPVDTDWAKLRDQLQNEILPRGNELLSKVYQNYLFGGLPVTTLLWHERQLYEAELQYRLALARAEMQASASE